MSEFSLALLNLGLRPLPGRVRGRVIAARDRDEPMTPIERAKASRAWLLEILQRGGRHAIADMGDETGLSRPTIAHHLRMLEIAGRAEVTPVHNGNGGRPRLLWQAASGEDREAA